MSPVRMAFKRVAIGLAIVMIIAGCGATSIPPASGPSDVPRSTPSAFVLTPTHGANPSLIPTAPTGAALDGSPVTDQDADEQFKLTIQADQDRYRAGQLITVHATLTYLGPDQQAVAVGSGSGVVGFSLERQVPPVRIDAAGTTDCKPYRFTRAQPVNLPFVKSGGFGEDPLADFYRAYFASPELRLPAGSWTIEAGASFFIGACGGAGHRLNASVTVVVEP
jgi:hypothetical protein